MSPVLIFLIAAIIFLLLISLLFFIPGSRQNKKKLHHPYKNEKNRIVREKNDSDHPLTPPEREEMLEGVKNFTINNPEKTAEMLKKWIQNGKNE